MSIVINLTPAEEARLSTEATQNGLAPEELVQKVLREHWTPPSATTREDILAKLHQWQKETKTETTENISAHELFARWAEEDANLTDEEIAANDRLWEDFQKGIDEERRNTGMRTLFSA